MADRYDLISPREGKEKTFWHRVGTGFKREKGGYSLVFDSLPLPDKDGRVSLLMVPPKPKNVTGEQLAQATKAAWSTDDLDDEITF